MEVFKEFLNSENHFSLSLVNLDSDFEEINYNLRFKKLRINVFDQNHK